MRIFAIGDLHLSKQDKPMDIFGREWIDHSRKIKEAWLRLVANDDVVLIPGDISWAMGLEDAYEDLADILTLPGEKIFIRGNHDYWWSSYNKCFFGIQKRSFFTE
jgi:predicted phosphohydrolase